MNFEGMKNFRRNTEVVDGYSLLDLKFTLYYLFAIVKSNNNAPFEKSHLEVFPPRCKTKCISHCHGCIEMACPKGKAVELDDEGNPTLSLESWVMEGKQILWNTLNP